MTAVMSFGAIPSRHSSKGRSYFRSSSLTTQAGCDGARYLSAAERLEADKLKYVKSAQARQKRTISEIRPFITSRNLDSTGTHSSGSDSTSLGDNSELKIKPSENKWQFHSSIAELGVSVRARPPQHKPRPYSSIIDELDPSWENFRHSTDSPKDTRDQRQDVAAFPDSSNTTNRPWSARSKSYYSARSSSLGAGTPRNKEIEGGDSSPESHRDHNGTIMSPRSQLRHAREKLRKVVTSPGDENQTSYSFRSRQIIFPKDEASGGSGSGSGVKLRTNSATRKQHRTRPLSVIENIKHFERFASLGADIGEVPLHKVASSPLLSNSNKAEKFTARRGSCSVSNSQKFSERQIKRRSLDLSRTLDTSLQLPQNEAEKLEPNKIKEGFNKSWSCDKRRESAVSSELKRNQESCINISSSRKNFARTDGTMNNSDPEDDMDTAYSSLSPNTSTGSKTIIVNPLKENKQKNASALSINDALNGKTTDMKMIEPKNYGNINRASSNIIKRASFSRSDSIGYSSHQNTSLLDKTSFEIFDDGSLPAPADHSVTSPANDSTKAVQCQPGQYIASVIPDTAQPINKINLASSSRQPPGFKSTILAPRERKEVAPDYSLNGITGSMSHTCLVRDEHSGAVKSQTTTFDSDFNKKLFTTFSASGTKSRDMVSHSVPKKYNLQQRDNNGVTKQPNNGLLSASPSANKQPLQFGHPSSTRSSSTPYSSLKHIPMSSRNSSLTHNKQRSRSDVTVLHNELDRFFATLGMDESVFSRIHSCDLGGAHVSSESDFSFAGASAYVRDSGENTKEFDPFSRSLASVPSVSVIEKNARVMKWILSCKKSMAGSKVDPSGRKSSAPAIPPRSYFLSNSNCVFSDYASPIPSRSYHTMAALVPIESDV